MPNLNILVLGGGVSGLGAVNLAMSQGYKIRLSDSKTLTPEQQKIYASLGVEIFIGEHQPSLLENVSKIILSPGIPYHSPLVTSAKARGIEVLSEIDYAMQDFTGNVISITGTNGKSTVCAMLKHIFDTLKIPVDLAGNFGTPPAEIRSKRRLHQNVILELSSYQLEQTFQLKNTVGIFTSFSHDHLSRHGTLENYFATKWKLSSLSNKLWLITQAVEKESKKYALKNPSCAEVVVEATDDFSLASGQAEPHNALNAKLASLAAEKILNVPALELAGHLKEFQGLAHRCQKIGFFQNYQLIDDSKSTNVESTLVALQSSGENIVLMLGGIGKGESYTAIVDFKNKIKSVIIFGQTGVNIFADLKNSLNCHVFKTCAEACSFVKKSLIDQTMPPDTVVLFSPACASFDEFKNFEERGLFFQRAFLT